MTHEERVEAADARLLAALDAYHRPLWGEREERAMSRALTAAGLGELEAENERLRELAQSVQRMVDDGFPCGGGGDTWFRVLVRRLAALNPQDGEERGDG